MKKHIFILSGLLIACNTFAIAQTPVYLQGNERQAYINKTTEVENFAQIAVGDEMGKLIIKHHLTPVEQPIIRSIVQERETRMATCNILYPENDTIRYMAKSSIAAEYRNTMVRTLFQFGKIVGSYNCRMIMRNKEVLNLTPSQQILITDWVVKVDKMLEDNSSIELRPYEFPLFSKIFTPEQLEEFLNLKLHDEVIGQINKTWKTLKDNGLEYGMDSTTTAKELFSYHMARDKAIYVNYNNQAIKDAALKSINDAAPLAIRRANSVSESLKAKNAYNGTLTW